MNWKDEKLVQKSMSPDHAEAYRFRFEKSGWANFYIDEAWGTLFIKSDWGDASYAWHNRGEGHTVKSFICDAEAGYIVDKLSHGDDRLSSDGMPNTIDFERTRERMFEHLADVGELTDSNRAAVVDHIADCEGLDNPALAIDRLYWHPPEELSEYDFCECLCRVVSPKFYHFRNRLVPFFQEFLIEKGHLEDYKKRIAS